MKLGRNLEEIFSYIHNGDEGRHILLLCKILCSQLSFTTNMEEKKKPAVKKPGAGLCMGGHAFAWADHGSAWGTTSTHGGEHARWGDGGWGGGGDGGTAFHSWALFTDSTRPGLGLPGLTAGDQAGHCL
jgi:hypothetical protein